MVWLTILVGGQLIVSIALVVYLVRLHGRKKGEAHSPSTLSAERMTEVLDAAVRRLENHSENLQRFETTLQRHDRQASDVDASHLGGEIDAVRRSNRDVEQAVSATIDEITDACDELLGREKRHLAAYVDKTAALEESLDEIDPHALVAGFAAKLLNMVHDLSQDNSALREEVINAQRKTIELLSRVQVAERGARIDALTQLANRRVFDESVQKCIARLKKSGEPFSVILFDIDHFKRINDRFGHSAGDAVLAMVGRIFRETCKTSDEVCRLGGEEFAMVLPGCDADSLRAVAERLRKKVENASVRFDGRSLSVTMSCGGAQAQLRETSGEILKRADEALYRAKISGRNRSVMYHELAGDDAEQAATTAVLS